MTDIVEHRQIEDIKKSLDADAGSNVILNWKDALYLGSYITALENNSMALSQRANELEDLLAQINEQLSKGDN